MSDAAPQDETEPPPAPLSPQEALELLQGAGEGLTRETRKSPSVLPLPEAPREPPRPALSEADPGPPPPPAFEDKSAKGRGALASVLALIGQLAIAAALVLLALAILRRPEAPRERASPRPLIDRALALPGAAREGGGALVPFGADGKALYADGAGRFLVLAPIADGGLAVERALDLVVDPTRFHNDARRRPHAYYLEDVGAARSAYLRPLRTELETLVRGQRLEDLPRIEELCERLAAFHDVVTLEVYLRSERFVVRRAAAVALGEAGYLMATPVLIFSLDTKDAAFRARLNTILEGLTGERFITDPEPRDQEAAKARAAAWLKANPLPSPYALGLDRRRALEKRLSRGLSVGG